MRTLEDWLAWGRELEAIYQAELGRSASCDPIAFTNWTFHRVMNGESIDWIRARIRESHEWKMRQQSGQPPEQPGQAPVTGSGRVIKVAGDDFHPRFYSYWSNAYIQGESAFVFAGHRDGYPRFYKVNLATGESIPLMPGSPAGVSYDLSLVYVNSTTEGWSWDREGFIHWLDGPRLVRSNPFTGQNDVLLDISESHPGCRLWQSHSEGDTHCATVERIVADGPYQRIGTIARRGNTQHYFPAEGALDESQITGQWLIIKEARTRDGRARLDNRIVDLETGYSYWVPDEAGAFGHSDGEGGILFGEDDQQGACVRWDLRSGHRQKQFATWNMGHVSYRGERCIVSDDVSISEVTAEGKQSIIDHGVNVTDYDTQVRANLDPTGRVACYMANGRVYLLVL